jgi:creatinine amidohydrolase
MTSPTPPRDWIDIRWPDIAGADPSRWIAVLPLAATEQHGPHLPVGTDVMIGEAYLARVRELLPPAIPATFLPIQPIGISTEHIHYPDTLTLPTEVALKAWMGLGERVARAGVRKLVMVTSHGGNSAAMVETGDNDANLHLFRERPATASDATGESTQLQFAGRRPFRKLLPVFPDQAPSGHRWPRR